MNIEKYNELFNKYRTCLNKPIEIFTYDEVLKKKLYKKFILKDISCIIGKEENGIEVVTSSVLIENPDTKQNHQTNLLTLEKNSRLIDLGTLPILKLSKENPISSLSINNSIEFIDVTIIQLGSHLGTNAEEWTKVLTNLYLEFNSKRTSENPSTIQEKLFLSSLIGNQVQPVFNYIKRFPEGNDGLPGPNRFYDTIEIELKTINEMEDDYEITIIYDRKP